MFPYWNAPPSMLRTLARRDDLVQVQDDKLHFRDLAVLAGEELGSLLSRIRCYVRDLLYARTEKSQTSPCGA